jgi:hypothetical protein
MAVALRTLLYVPIIDRLSRIHADHLVGCKLRYDLTALIYTEREREREKESERERESERACVRACGGGVIWK